jgi:hypothetical protein
MREPKNQRVTAATLATPSAPGSLELLGQTSSCARKPPPADGVHTNFVRDRARLMAESSPLRGMRTGAAPSERFGQQRPPATRALCWCNAAALSEARFNTSLGYVGTDAFACACLGVTQFTPARY